jgi:hypothetical protein
MIRGIIVSKPGDQLSMVASIAHDLRFATFRSNTSARASG